MMLELLRIPREVTNGYRGCFVGQVGGFVNIRRDILEHKVNSHAKTEELIIRSIYQVREACVFLVEGHCVGETERLA